MYLFFGILILFLLFFVCINYRHKKEIIENVCTMCHHEKCETLNDLIRPLGYAYVPSQDIFTSRIDAWQRTFGYRAFYDGAASYAGMVFDCLPVYFQYHDKTWLIEFWKGQYGINAGCEIGVYHADRILAEDDLEYALFHSVSDADMLKLSFTLYEKGAPIAQLEERHWWLTAFDPGRFCHPSDLIMQASITLYNKEMAAAFANGLVKAGYCSNDIFFCGSTVTFTFSRIPAGSTHPCGIFRKLQLRIVQWFNRLGCGIYLFVTKPFHTSLDRLLYLYFYLPFIFRRMFRNRKKGRFV